MILSVLIGLAGFAWLAFLGVGFFKVPWEGE